MAAGMGHTKLDEILAKLTTLQENQARLINKQKNILFLNDSVKEFTIGLQNLDANVEQIVCRNSQIPLALPVQSTIQPHSTHQGPNLHADFTAPLKSMCLEVPRFFGDNPSAWIFRIQWYFDFYNTPDSQRLLIAPFHLDGDALDWYDWVHHKQLLLSWNDFLLAIENRFGPSANEDSLEKSNELMQSGALAAHDLFDQLSNPIIGVPATSFHADYRTTNQEEQLDNNEGETNERDFKNAKLIHNGEGCIACESELVMTPIEHHGLELVAYLGELVNEESQKIEGQPIMLHIYIRLWDGKVV